MQVSASVWLKNGTVVSHCVTTRTDLAEFWTRNRERVDLLVADIGLTRWFWTEADGWWSMSMFKYVPNRPDLWQQRGTPKPAMRGPFDTPPGW